MHCKLVTWTDGISHLVTRCGRGHCLWTRVQMIDRAQARVSPANVKADVEHCVISLGQSPDTNTHHPLDTL